MKKILVVDDDHSTSQLIVRYLRSMDFETDIAASGIEAIEKIQRNSSLATAFDVIISDVRMPYGSGIDLCREILSGGVEIPVILMSAASAENEGAKLQAKAMGKTFLVKPIIREELHEALENVLRNRTHKTNSDPDSDSLPSKRPWPKTISQTGQAESTKGSDSQPDAQPT